MGFIIATLIVLVVIASVVAQDFSVFSWAYWQEGDTSTSRSEVVRNLGILAAAVIGLGFGIWRAVTGYIQARASQRQAEAANEQAEAANEQAEAANEQARIAQQGHITDRFSTAVEHLGSEQLPVRLGGIYALWRLIKDSPERDVISVIDILCAFVRHPPHEPAGPLEPDDSNDGVARGNEEGPTNRVRPDVQTVVSLIGKEKDDYRALLPAGYYLDLTGADLTDAHLWNADLTGANLDDANLTHTALMNTNFTGARLINANLTGAPLMDTNLTDANLSVANLTDADLTGANLTDANLTAALLTVTNITQEQLDSACISKGGPPPTLPEGLNPPQKECGRLTR